MPPLFRAVVSADAQLFRRRTAKRLKLHVLISSSCQTFDSADCNRIESRHRRYLHTWAASHEIKMIYNHLLNALTEFADQSWKQNGEREDPRESHHQSHRCLGVNPRVVVVERDHNEPNAKPFNFSFIYQQPTHSLFTVNNSFVHFNSAGGSFTNNPNECLKSFPVLLQVGTQVLSYLTVDLRHEGRQDLVSNLIECPEDLGTWWIVREWRLETILKDLAKNLKRAAEALQYLRHEWMKTTVMERIQYGLDERSAHGMFPTGSSKKDHVGERIEPILHSGTNRPTNTTEWSALSITSVSSMRMECENGKLKLG